MKIGEKIKELRKKRGITQEQLAEKLGISFQAVSKWENEIALPDITLVTAIASFFGVTTDYLFDYTVPPPIEVQVIKPATYEDINKIVEMLQNNKTVIINFEETDEEVKTQIINKITVDIDVIGEHFEKISDTTYIVTPKGQTV